VGTSVVGTRAESLNIEHVNPTHPKTDGWATREVKDGWWPPESKGRVVGAGG